MDQDYKCLLNLSLSSTNSDLFDCFHRQYILRLTCASTFGGDGEVAGFPADAMGQPRAVCGHIATANGVDVELER